MEWVTALSLCGYNSRPHRGVSDMVWRNQGLCILYGLLHSFKIQELTKDYKGEKDSFTVTNDKTVKAVQCN